MNIFSLDQSQDDLAIAFWISLCDQIKDQALWTYLRKILCRVANLLGFSELEKKDFLGFFTFKIITQNGKNEEMGIRISH